jgi:hypothetical protein
MSMQEFVEVTLATERVCGGHIGYQALAAKILRQGFYWPTMTTTQQNW